MRNSPAVQWLELHIFTAKGQGSIPGQGTKIPQLCGVAQINIKKIKTEKSNDPEILLLSIYPKEMKTLT